jgi:drug/metabolite transporter (DMT)-like permease
MVSNMTAVMLVSAVILAPFGLLPGVWSIEPSRASVVATLMLILLSTTIGNFLLLTLVQRAGAAFAGQVNFLVPVFGVIAGALILGERPSANAIAGLALVLVGVAVARRGAGLRSTPQRG